MMKLKRTYFAVLLMYLGLLLCTGYAFGRTIHLEAENYSSQSGIFTSSSGGVDYTGWIDHGDWIAFSNIDLGSGAANLTVNVAGIYNGGKIEMRLDDVTGTLAGTLVYNPTGNWTVWEQQPVAVSSSDGVHTVYFVFVDGPSYMYNIDWIEMSVDTDETVPAPTPSPDPEDPPDPSGDPDEVNSVWSSSAVYYAPDRVYWNTHNWEAKWWTQGDEPGTTGEWGVWLDLGVSNDTPAPTPSPDPVIPPDPSGDPDEVNLVWSSATVYYASDRVYWDSHNWEAKWWTQGDEPGTTGEWGVWLDLGVSNVTPTPDPIPTPTNPGFPNQVFAPYVDVLLYPPFDLTDAVTITDSKYFTMAFIVSDASGKASWGGVIPLEDEHMLQEVYNLRGMGGDVVISFGGANGTELSLAIDDIDTLKAEYQAVIDMYHVTWVDFDIEGFAVADKPSIDRRNQAIAGLQADNPDLTIAFCLPVLPSGLTADGLYVLQNAVSHGVRVDMVNIMAMDYGDWAAPNPDGQMGQYAIDAADSLLGQLQTLYPDKPDNELWAMVGVTPMIGQNDVISEVFYLSDAQQLLTYAQQRNIGMLSMWSLSRDNGSAGTCNHASPTYSCLEQESFAFTNILKAFNQ